MSGMYYKVNPSPIPAHLYGFRRASPKEINDITQRLSRATYNRNLSTTHEQKQVHNYEYLCEQAAYRRTPSACTRRTSVTPSTRCSSAKRLSDRDMQRLLRRLLQPTENIVNGRKTVDQKDEELKSGKIVRPKELDEKTAKLVTKLSRPTTASRAKNLTTCYLCYEHEQKGKNDPPDAFDYEYGDNRTVLPEDMEFITERMLQPTCVSAGSYKSCAKSPLYIDEVRIRQNVPLVSGLQRSRNVKEIVQRLYPVQPRYRMTPAATAITVY